MKQAIVALIAVILIWLAAAISANSDQNANTSQTPPLINIKPL